MDYFPVFVNLKLQRVLIVGGGTVAERKARLLLDASAKVSVIAKELNNSLSKWLDEGKVEYLGPEFREDLLEGVRLVFAATNDSQLNSQVFQSAEKAGVLVNVVDDPARCRFLSPAIIDRSPVQIAISTGGNSPVLARVLRGWVERLLPLGLGRVAAAAGILRAAVKQSLPQEQRRGFWEGLLQEKRIRAWSLQEQDRIERQFRELLDRTAVAKKPAQGNASSTRNGKVFLVGGGPGRADLLTLRALHVLGQADVILHDQLVSTEVLDLARRDADRIDVGKRAGKHHQTQVEIHGLMKLHAEQGRTVVRLKGGDPFVFGRGGEEMEFLADHGIEYEVVPGISAAMACAAYSGIPLTHREHASSLTFITGHAASLENSPATGTDWRAIAGPGKTAVIYMGLKQAGKLRTQLLEAGIAPDLPVALVANGSLENQQVLCGTISSLEQLAGRISPGVPTLLVIGQVAALGSRLNWFKKPAPLQIAA